MNKLIHDMFEYINLIDSIVFDFMVNDIGANVDYYLHLLDLRKEPVDNLTKILENSDCLIQGEIATIHKVEVFSSLSVIHYKFKGSNEVNVTSNIKPVVFL